MNHVLVLVKYFSPVEYFFFTNTLEMAVSGNLKALKLFFSLARRQPWWRLVRFGPPNIRNLPTPLFQIMLLKHRTNIDRQSMAKIY